MPLGSKESSLPQHFKRPQAIWHINFSREGRNHVSWLKSREVLQRAEDRLRALPTLSPAPRCRPESRVQPELGIPS